MARINSLMRDLPVSCGPASAIARTKLGDCPPNAVPDKMSSSTVPSAAFMGVLGAVGTVRDAPVKRLKKPDFAGLAAAAVEPVADASERILAALEPGAEAAGVAYSSRPLGYTVL